MIPLGLSAVDQRAYHAALLAPVRRIRVGVQIMDLSENVLVSATPHVLDGQVNVDADAGTSRSATMTLFDPTATLDFDTGSPNDGAMYLDRMLKIHYGVWVPDLLTWVDCPVFTGPVSKFDRDSYQVSIEAQGKETLARAAAWRPLVLKQGMRKVDAIRTLLSDRAGERRFAFGNFPSRLPETVNVFRTQYPWTKARRIAFGMNRQLYYNGDGVCRLRAYPQRPAYEFTSGTDDANITEPIQVSTSLDNVRNTILVKGKKRGIEAEAVAPRNHPLSPWNLGRNGTPRYIVEEHEDDSLRSDKACQEVADRLLKDRLRAAVEVTYSALPIPHLDEYDIAQVSTEQYSFEHQLKQWSLPLTADGQMMVGFHRRVSVNRRAIRR